MGKLIIDGNSVYEIDEDCIRRKEKEESQRKEREQTEGNLGYGGRPLRRKPQNFFWYNKKPGPAAAGPGFLEFFLIVLAEGIAAAIAAPSAAAEEQ